jgi:pyruvate formate lyase activating enzyme
MDAANVDLKAFTEEFYHRTCLAHLDPVLDTLRYLKHETNVWFEITNLLIPGHNDSPDEIKAMCDWITRELGPDVPVHFTAFHPDFKMMDTPPTPPATLTRAREIAIAEGVRYAYTGNTYDVGGQSTYCHDCGERVIERDWYELGAYRLSDDGQCNSCGARCAGVFAGRPGVWGRRRLPVRLADIAAR